MQKSGFEVLRVCHRPDGLLDYLFCDGYPKGCRVLLKTMDQLLKVILVRKGISNYFSVIAKKTAAFPGS